MPYYLADSDIEILFGVIVFVIWVLSALAGKLKKQPTRQPGQPRAETTMEKLQREVIERLREMHGPNSIPPPPPPREVPPRYAPPPLPPSPRPQSMRPMPPKAPPRVAPKQQKQPKVRRPAVQVFSEMPPPLPPEPLQVGHEIPPGHPLAATPVKRPAAGVDATAIRAWLKPTTLQKQFILTELFQPPLSMREQP